MDGFIKSKDMISKVIRRRILERLNDPTDKTEIMVTRTFFRKRLDRSLKDFSQITIFDTPDVVKARRDALDKASRLYAGIIEYQREVMERFP